MQNPGQESPVKSHEDFLSTILDGDMKAVQDVFTVENINACFPTLKFSQQVDLILGLTMYRDAQALSSAHTATYFVLQQFLLLAIVNHLNFEPLLQKFDELNLSLDFTVKHGETEFSPLSTAVVQRDKVATEMLCFYGASLDCSVFYQGKTRTVRQIQEAVQRSDDRAAAYATSRTQMGGVALDPDINPRNPAP